MQFTHLKDTEFPNLPTVNVYQFQNNFDYTRWNKKTRVKLCNVIWNSDYTDVVKFDTDSMRDNWFDSLSDSWSLDLNTDARIVPEGYVKLPIPYDVMARYNYLFIDMPIATSEEQMIDYEKRDGLRRWYFFVNDIAYLSPNATQVYVVPDVWTNFQNDIDITYMLLERGHAPVAASDTDSYLQNPIANNRYLLAPDVNFDNAGITRSSSFVPFGNGTKYVCIASTCTPDLISTLGTVYADSSYNPSGPITYSDIQIRYGHQLQVNGFTIGNGMNYSDANTPAKVGYSDGLIANNLCVYAIAATECYGNGTFFNDVLSKCPQFLTTVQGCFVVDGNCLTLGSTYTIAGHTVYQCKGKESTLLTKALSKSEFGYPQELQRFAKLYTAPYAQLEITDNNGNTYDVNIEETTTLTVKSVVALAFPYINERVYIEGIGGTGSKSYSWVDLKGNTSALNMPNSDWFKYCFDWNIPTFALYMDGETAFMLESFNRAVKQADKQAIVDYHVTMRSANTSYENACDQSDVAYSNTNQNAQAAQIVAHNSADTARQNAYNYADTAKTNSYNSADTAHTNAYNYADTVHTNAYNDANTAHTNAYNDADTVHTNTYNLAETEYDNVDRSCTTLSQNLATENARIALTEEYGIATSDTLEWYGEQQASVNVNWANQLCQYTTDQNAMKSTASSVTSAIGNIATSAISSAASGAMFGAGGGAAVGSIVPGAGTAVGAGVGAAIGAGVGIVSGGISASVSMVSNGISALSDLSIAQAQIDYNNNSTSSTNDFAGKNQDEQDSLRRAVYGANATASTQQQNNSNATSRTNADASRDTAEDNADNNKDTAETNADNLRSTARTNADNIKDTAEDNADNTRSTTKTNADNTRGTARTNADNTRTTSRGNADLIYVTTEATADATRDNIQANSLYTRETEEANAKEILENKRNSGMAAILDARNAAPIEVCQYSGDPTPDYMRTRGVQIKVKTQSDSAIRQTGDTFARFGYALNQVWNVAQSGLKLMRHFTYWKATEVWVDDRESSNNAVNNFIHRMFLNGVTVWNNPEEIGRVNVYDN